MVGYTIGMIMEVKLSFPPTPDLSNSSNGSSVDRVPPDFEYGTTTLMFKCKKGGTVDDGGNLVYTCRDLS